MLFPCGVVASLNQDLGLKIVAEVEGNFAFFFCFQNRESSVVAAILQLLLYF